MNDSIQRDDVPLVLVSSFIDTSYLNITSESREERVELRKTKRPLREHDKETDLLRVLYVSEFVMKRLGVYDGSWIDLKVMERKYAVRVFEIPTEERRVARAPISIIFNVLNGEERQHVTLCSRDVSDRQECKLAKISRVNTPSSSAYASYTASLIRHFTLDRVLSVGDVFGVPVSVSYYRDDSMILGDDDESSEESSADEDEIPQDFTRRTELVYFQVMSLDDNEKNVSKIVSRRFTQLEQKGSVRSKVPRKEDMISFVVSTRSVSTTTTTLKTETKTTSNHEKLAKLLRVTATSKAASLILLGGMRGSGKRELVRDVASTVGMHVLECNALIMIQDLAREQRRRGRSDDGDQVKKTVLNRLLDRASSLSPCVIHFRRLPSKSLLRDPSVGGILDVAEKVFVRKLRDVLCGAGKEPSVAVIGSTSHIILTHMTNKKQQPNTGTDDIESMTKTMRSCFTHEIEMNAPASKSRDGVFRNWLDDCDDEIVNHAVSISAGRCRSDLRNMVAAATTKLLQRNKDSIGEFKTEDFDFAASNVEAQSSMGVEQPKVPKIYWDDVGGLEHAKKEIQELIELPLKQPELFAATGGGGRSGILLYVVTFNKNITHTTRKSLEKINARMRQNPNTNA